jgi:hypothetical protein
VGISGSSIKNMIIANTAYSNPVPQTSIEGGGPIVGSNYYFVTNVFNQLFGIAPTDLQNISLDGCVPICAPDDLALIIKQTEAKACIVDSKIGDLGDDGSCFGDLITVPEDINNLNINLIGMLKSIFLDLRGCGETC